MRRGSLSKCNTACRMAGLPYTGGSLTGLHHSISRQQVSVLAEPESREKPASADEGFKAFLLRTEEDSPLWYRFSDLYLTLLGAFCFYAEILEPKVSERYFLPQVEDIVNVNFFAKFLLLFWANNFNLVWLFTPKATLDLASCLPVLDIFARFFDVRPVGFDLLQLARFLRLLRESLPSSQPVEVETLPLQQRKQRNRGALQTVTLFLALAGSVAVSATLLCLYEGQKAPSFDDAVLYMVAVFAGREVPFRVVSSGAKEVTVAATLVSLVFVPFLISESILVFMGPNAFQRFMSLPASSADTAGPGIGPGFVDPTAAAASAGLPAPLESESGSSEGVWARAILHVDALEDAGLLSPAEGLELRRRFLSEDPQGFILEQCYGENWIELPALLGAETDAWKRYAARLREWLSNDTQT